MDTGKWLTALPVAARPDTRNMLVVGFGGGVALEGVPPSVESVDVIELEPEVIVANRRLAGMRDIDPLADPRFNIVINDARNALRLTRKSYDAIVSQPSHPWTAGASHLFTREFVADARNHLNDGGVFLQWMNAEFLDEALLRTLAATLTVEFEYVRLYNPTARVLMFLASDAPLDIELELARTGRPFIDAPMHFSRLGLNAVEDLLMQPWPWTSRASCRSPAGPGSAPTTTTSWRPEAAPGRTGWSPRNLAELFDPYDPTGQSRGAGSTPGWAAKINYGYLARRLISHGADAAGNPQWRQAIHRIPPVSSRSTDYCPGSTGQGGQARESFNNALRANPLNMQARYSIVSDHLEAVQERRSTG